MLLAAALIGVAAALPMLLQMIPQIAPPDRPSVPLPLLIILGIGQNLLLFGVAVAVGMRLAPRVGTGAPIIEGWIAGETPRDIARSLRVPLVIGLAVGIALVVIDVAIFLPRVPAAIARLAEGIPAWKRLLAGFLYGGITEEILMRWFLLSLVVWLLARAWRTSDGRPTSGAWWTAIVVVALLFGIGHLPTTSAITPLTSMVVVRALVLNGIAGLTFGYLFWRSGLEAAMAAHLATHVGLQLVGPALAARLAEP